MTTIPAPALRLTVIVGESAQWQHHAAFTEIVHRAHAAGLAGATVLRGVEGFGAAGHIHTTRILSLSEDLPVVILVVDEEKKIRDFLPQLDDVVTKGLVILDGVEVIRYVGGESAATA